MNAIRFRKILLQWDRSPARAALMSIIVIKLSGGIMDLIIDYFNSHVQLQFSINLISPNYK